MVTVKYASTVLGFALAGVLSTTAVKANELTLAEVEPEVSGVRLQIVNDLFAGGERDRDYTGGMSITLSVTAARNVLLSLDPLLA